MQISIPLAVLLTVANIDIIIIIIIILLKTVLFFLNLQRLLWNIISMILFIIALIMRMVQFEIILLSFIWVHSTTNFTSFHWVETSKQQPELQVTKPIHVLLLFYLLLWLFHWTLSGNYSNSQKKLKIKSRDACVYRLLVIFNKKTQVDDDLKMVLRLL